MRAYEESQLDPKVIPLVRYFNSIGLPTQMSCQGHNKTNMSMFWIEFDESVTEQDIIAFQCKHTDKFGGFCCNGRFVLRLLANTTGIGEGVARTYQYMAATVKAAEEDLRQWEEQDLLSKNTTTLCCDCQYIGDKYSFPLPNNLIEADPDNPAIKHYYCCCGDSALYSRDITSLMITECEHFEEL